MNTKILLLSLLSIIGWGNWGGFSSHLMGQSSTPLINKVINEAPNTESFGINESILRGQIVTLNDINASKEVQLNLFEDIQLTAQLTNIDKHNNGATVWRGAIRNQNWGYVLISQFKDAYWIKIELEDGRIFQIQPESGDSFRNQYLLSEVIGADGQGFDCQGEVTDESFQSNDPSSSARQKLTSVCDVGADCSGEVVHVMVVYTPAASQYFGGAVATESAIAMAVSEMNIINSNSGVNNTFNLTHTQEINYAESSSGNTDLNRLANETDGFVDEVHVLRNQFGADVVSMVVTSACGVGQVNTDPNNYYSSSAFSVVGTSCMATNKSLAHEVGHNMGLRHDRYAYGNSLPNIACDWAWGFVNPNAVNGTNDQKWRTVMAYNDFCEDNNTSCVRIPHWSNPAVDYLGDPTGIAIGQPDQANSAYMLNRAMCLISDFKDDPPCHPDFLSLKRLYATADGGNWGVNWDTTANGNCTPCSWDGIQCNVAGRVIALDLSNKALNGFLPAEIGWLSELETLKISNTTNLNGSLPTEIRLLQNLKILDLSNNNLTGDLPSGIGQLEKIEKMLLAHNSLSGAIPRKVGTLLHLNKLDFSHNNLDAFLPSSFGLLPLLDTLLINDNQLTGPLPKELANLSNTIDLLKADNNDFSDCFPVEFATLCGQSVTFSNNPNLQYQGDFTQFCANPNQSCNQQACTHPDFAALEALFTSTNGEYWNNNQGWLSDCEPCQGIPWEGVFCTGNRVTHIYLNNNLLSGTLPSEISQLTELKEFVLSQNNLTGSIPPEIGQLAKLTSFNLSNNNLTGSIPNEVGLLTNLEYLSLVKNDLVGPLPPDLVNAPLSIFSIFGNSNFSSCYPVGYDVFCNITFNVSGTMMLSFPDYCNNGAGECLPNGGCGHPDYAALDSLYKATNGDNWTDNTGWLQDCDPCNWFGVICDNFNRVQNINLPNNNLTGSLPEEIGDLSTLITLNLENNGLTGAIPSTIENLTNLSILNIRANSLSGSIPTELGNMTGLFSLNLGYNDLIGNLPIELGGMTSISYLNLQNNDLSGPLPPELGNLSPNVLLLNNNAQLGGCYPAEYSAFCNINNVNFSGTLSPDFQTFCTNGTGTCITACHPDFLALKEIYSATDGANWKNNTNWDTTATPGCNPCNWYGITCDPVSNRVTEINLSFNDLDGVLPDVFGGMDSLTLITFYLNEELEGTLPTSLGSLPNLTNITFGQTPLITGPLPASWGNLTKLGSLNLGFSGLTGDIPVSYGNLVNLTYLSLGPNNLTGPIPDEFGNLVELRQLYLRNNNLSGQLPESLGNLVNLDFLRLENNLFDGCYPASYVLFCSDTINATIHGVNLPSFGDFCASGSNTCTANTCPIMHTLAAASIQDTTFKASETIISTDTINTPHTVNYEAGQLITLLPGFEVKAGATFTAKIADCSTNLLAPESSNNRNTIATKFNASTTKLEVYPNPFTTQTNIKFTIAEAGPIQIQLMDLTGRILQTVVPQSHYDSGSYQMILLNDDWQSGIYFVRLISSEGQLVKKVMVVK